MTTLSETEYNDWLTQSEIIENDSIRFSACSGPHEFAMIIRREGTLYELFHGWNSHHDRDFTWWGVKPLHKDFGQEGDGI